MATPTQTDVLVGRSLPSLINGVSQQPAHVRLPTEGEEQENCLSKVVEGLARRPPTEHVVKVINGTDPAGGYFEHLYDRDGEEQYAIFISDSAIVVYDFEGNACTVSSPDGVGYLNFDSSTEDAIDQFRAITVGDTTFIVNRYKTVAMSGSSASARPTEFMFWAKQDPVSAKSCNLEFGSTVVSWSCGADPATSIDNLLTALAASGLAATWTFTRVGGAAAGKASLMYGVMNSGSAPSHITYSDGFENSLGKLIYKKVQRFSDLPGDAEGNFRVEIVGDNGDIEDNYWVKYDEAEHAWVECVAPGLDNSFNAATMPHRLVRTALNTFTFEEIPWDSREKGDAVSAPEPSFVGKEIREVVFHKDRLGLLAVENAVMSETGHYFNFWPTTVTTTVDSDPLDLSGSSNRVTFLDWAVPFDHELTLFSAKGGVQQEMKAGDGGVLSPATGVIVEQAAYTSSNRVRPQSIGRALYFVTDRETASGVYEYTALQNDRHQADEITAHIPSYLPGNISRFTSSSNEQMLAVVSPDDPNAIYVYGFHILGSDKIMSSWSRWSFGGEVRGMCFVNSSLYILFKRDDPAVFLEKLNLRKLTDAGLDYRCFIDSQASVTGTYSGVTGLTSWTLPYEIQTAYDYMGILADEDWDSDLGKSLVLTVSNGSTTVTASGDWSANPVLFGRKFLSRYVFSPAVVENAHQSAANASLSKLMLRTWAVAFKDTGYFKILVDSREDTDATAYEHEYTGRTLGSFSSIIGSPRLSTGSFTVAANGDAKNVRVALESDAYLPFIITSAEWEGLYTQRTRQV